MRLLAIDLGSRRVGLALSDEGERFATPLEVLNVSSPEEAARQVRAAIVREAAEKLVVGLPLNMDDSIGPAARSVLAWVRSLTSDLQIPVIFVDERLSTFAAEQRLLDQKRGGQKMTRGQKKKRLDAHAAAGFLQEFLDGALTAIEI